MMVDNQLTSDLKFLQIYGLHSHIKSIQWSARKNYDLLIALVGSPSKGRESSMRITLKEYVLLLDHLSLQRNFSVFRHA